MEKDLHNDRLDEFVKKSFEDYEEDPSSGMWDRIEIGLPAGQPRVSFWRTYRWQIAAAAAILVLLSRLIYVQTYYETQLRNIAQQQEQQTPVSPEPVIAPQSIHTSPSDHLEISVTPVLPEQTSVKNPASPETLRSQKQNNHSRQNSTINTSLPASNKTAGKVHAPVPGSQTVVESNNGINNNDSRLPSSSQPPQPIVQNEPEPPQNQPTIIPDKWSELLALEVPRPTEKPDEDASKLTVNAPVKRLKVPSGWYLGISAAPHLIVERQQNTQRPGNGGPRPFFANRQEKPAPSVDLSIRVGKQLSRVWALESGVGFQNLSRTAVHRPHFEYHDGQVISGSGSNEARSFDYDLNTYGGSASVSLRTEVNGNNAPADSDRVGAVIQTNEHIQLLRIPLLAAARWGKGRWQLALKAGVVGNVMLKNQLDIRAHQIENPRLRFRLGDEYSVQLNRPRHFVLGYQLAAGAEFRMTRNLSLSAGPALTGDFPGSNGQNGNLPSHTALGITVGANWWF